MITALYFVLTCFVLWAIYVLAHAPWFITACADILQRKVNQLRAWSTAQTARIEAYTAALKELEGVSNESAVAE